MLRISIPSEGRTFKDTFCTATDCICWTVRAKCWRIFSAWRLIGFTAAPLAYRLHQLVVPVFTDAQCSYGHPYMGCWSACSRHRFSFSVMPSVSSTRRFTWAAFVLGAPIRTSACVARQALPPSQEPYFYRRPAIGLFGPSFAPAHSSLIC